MTQADGSFRESSSLSDEQARALSAAIFSAMHDPGGLVRPNRVVTLASDTHGLPSIWADGQYVGVSVVN